MTLDAGINLGAFVDRKIEELRGHEEAAARIRAEIKDARSRLSLRGIARVRKASSRKARRRGAAVVAIVDEESAVVDPAPLERIAGV